MGKRFFRHGELPLVLLALLAEEPKHGYELMGELERLFGPAYRPSPGSVYPAVEALEAERLIRPRGKDGTRVYTLTSSGEDALNKRRHLLDAVEIRTGVRVAQRGSVDGILERFVTRVLRVAGRLDEDALEELLETVARDIEKDAVGKQATKEEGTDERSVRTSG